MILFAKAAPIPGSSFKSSAEAELISTSLDFVADLDGPALAWTAAVPPLGVSQRGDAIRHSDAAVSSRTLTAYDIMIPPGMAKRVFETGRDR